MTLSDKIWMALQLQQVYVFLNTTFAINYIFKSKKKTSKCDIKIFKSVCFFCIFGAQQMCIFSYEIKKHLNVRKKKRKRMTALIRPFVAEKWVVGIH